MKEKLFCVVGPSGCGKTTQTERMCKEYGLSSVQSMTTRPPRYEGETGHVFVSPEEFAKHKMVAYTLFNGYEYGVPSEMLDAEDFYVIDIAGVHTLRENYNGKKLVVIYLDITPEEQARRMQIRGDSEEKIASRLANDAIMFADVEGLEPDYIIDANRDVNAVYADFSAIVKSELAIE